MDRNPKVLYKTLIVGVIVLFILTCYPVTPCLSAPYNSTYCGWVDPNNQPPEPPIIDGPWNSVPDMEIEFSFKSIDPEGHDIAKYIIDWGDGTQENLTGPFRSGVEIFASHEWYYRGAYIVKAKAVDTYGGVGNWSEFEINIPRTNNNIDDCNLCPTAGNNKTICNLLIGLSKIVQVRMILKIFLASFLEYIPFEKINRIINPLIVIIYIRVGLFILTYAKLRDLLIKYDCFDFSPYTMNIGR
jgi:hypothetical protein